MKKKFLKYYLVNELDLPFSAIEDNVICNDRWSIFHEIIFQDKDGKFYLTWYSVGATECQDERPWEYDDTIECIEVEKRKVVVDKWVEV